MIERVLRAFQSAVDSSVERGQRISFDSGGYAHGAKSQSTNFWNVADDAPCPPPFSNMRDGPSKPTRSDIFSMTTGPKDLSTHVSVVHHPPHVTCTAGAASRCSYPRHVSSSDGQRPDADEAWSSPPGRTDNRHCQRGPIRPGTVSARRL